MEPTRNAATKLEPLRRVVESLRRGEIDTETVDRVGILIEEFSRSRDRELQESVLRLIREAQEAAQAWIAKVSERLDEFARIYQMKKAYGAVGRAID